MRAGLARVQAGPRAVITTVAPAEEPVSLEEAKAWLRVDHGDEDAQIAALIAAARQAVENSTKSRLITQAVRLEAAEFHYLAKPRIGPIQNAELRYIDVAGDEQTMPADDWRLIGGPLAPRVELVDGRHWPDVARRGDAVRLDAVVGYGDTGEDVPGNIRLAIQMLVTNWYDNREQSTRFAGERRDLSDALDWLLSAHTLQSVA